MNLKKKHKKLMSPQWLEFIFPKFSSDLKKVYSDLGKAEKLILPSTDEDIWKAFRITDFDNLKVVVIGQDPYHTVKDGKAVATGLCFQSGVEGYIPPSLKNIMKEIESDCYSKEFDTERLEIPDNKLWGERLSKQGVLLLNTALTVTQGAAGSHKTIWKNFTNKLIEELDKEKDDLVWLLMGNDAKKFIPLIQNGAIVQTGHPSPLNTKIPFKGSKPFSQVNLNLDIKNLEPIKW